MLAITQFLQTKIRIKKSLNFLAKFKFKFFQVQPRQKSLS